MPTNLAVLILGAGPRIGTAITEKFARIGYQVAIASRKGDGNKNANGILSLNADLNKPDSIPAPFDAVKTALTPPPDGKSTLSIAAENVVLDLNVNTIAPYVAAQEAIKGWETLPEGIKKTFIYTGNFLNVSAVPVPMFLTLGMGKSASAYWISVADATYAAQEYRFFYADERAEDGKSKGPAVDGPGHADFFAHLVTHEGNVPSQATFAAGKGYIQIK